jgi:hypothetical protein
MDDCLCVELPDRTLRCSGVRLHRHLPDSMSAWLMVAKELLRQTNASLLLIAEGA